MNHLIFWFGFPFLRWSLSPSPDGMVKLMVG